VCRGAGAPEDDEHSIRFPEPEQPVTVGGFAKIKKSLITGKLFGGRE
jgi:hypothetical protein